MNKISLDPDSLKDSDNNEVLLIARLINGINNEYPILRSGLKNYLFNALKEFTQQKEFLNNEENNFCYDNLIRVLYKLYPGEFQKELVK
jgi:hypothetical protein